MSLLSKDYFHDEKAAFGYLEGLLWKDGVICPKCGVIDHSYKLEGASCRIGLRKCASCKKQFTIRIGTVFQNSHIPLHKCLLAAYLLATAKKGISTHQMHRILGITYKSAWFLLHKLRQAMIIEDLGKIGGEGKIVEVDETYIGNKGKNNRGARGWIHMEKVFSFVERGGLVHSIHVAHTNVKTLAPLMLRHIDINTRVMTDQAKQYVKIGRLFIAGGGSHEVVNHSSGEYERNGVCTNTIEGFFSIFKRGMKGIYQHCSGHHLKRYLAEFDFKYNTKHITDIDRMNEMLGGIRGKLLSYKQLICISS